MKTQINYPLLNLVAYLDETVPGKPTLQIYRGKSKSSFPKPLVNYYYRSIEDRAKSLERYIQQVEKRQAEKLDRVKAKSEARQNLVNPFKLGDIFVNSWGYDQTNIDFYQVVEVKPKSVVIREIAAKMMPHEEGYSSMSGKVIAVKDSFTGDPILKPIQISYDNSLARISSKHGCMTLWDGNPEYTSWYA